ncbi:MAG: hypothetical protein IT444_13425 [Phycisphaeraceae bacterium]|nr:hypothetical protein [Phycisphaeraceae bacterium]
MADPLSRPNPSIRSAIPAPDSRAAARQKLIIVLLAGILLVAMGILIVLVVMLPHRMEQPQLNDRPIAKQTPPVLPSPVQTSPPAPDISTSRDVPAEDPPVEKTSAEDPAKTVGSSPVSRAERSLPRSPIPEPGEVITRPFPAVKVDSAEEEKSTTAPSSTEIVPWYEASKHVGQEITVEGRIVTTRRSGKVCFLNFSRDRESFYLIMFERTLYGWPEAPETYFKNKTIRAKGVVELHNQRPQIQIEKTGQLVVIE